MVERLIREGRPTTFTQAMLLIQEYEADDYRLHLALDEAVDGRQEEPMEVNAFHGPSKAPSAPAPQAASPTKDEMAKDLTDVKRQMVGLTQQFTKLMATLQSSSSHQASRPQSRQKDRSKQSTAATNNQSTINGQPRSWCDYCQKWGHVSLDCRKRLREQHGVTSFNSQPQGNQ